MLEDGPWPTPLGTTEDLGPSITISSGSRSVKHKKGRSGAFSQVQVSPAVHRWLRKAIQGGRDRADGPSR